MTEDPLLVGCDFSSSPKRNKPIVMAHGRLERDLVRLERLEILDSLAAFAAWLEAPASWICGFDFPFGLPRELVEQLGWPAEWEANIRHYAARSRAEITSVFDAFRAARPAGAKYAHRAVDRRAGSSSSMKCVRPPVAYMLHAGVPPMLGAGVHIPGLRAGDRRRVALEAYPGLLARELVGRRSYKNDQKAKQTLERRAAREDIVAALEAGRTRLGLRLDAGPLREELIADGGGDRLDAALCLLQAAWAARQGPPEYGLPPDLDPLEGWIVTA